MGELGIDLPSLLVQLINFLLLLGVLVLFLYKPITKMLDQRSQRIKESMEQAEQIKERMAQTEAEVKAQVESARKEGQAIIGQASQIGDRLKEEARREARQEAEALVARARSEISRERGEVIDQLRHEFADIAIQAAEKVINQTLDKRAHQRLIEEVLEESTALKRED